MYLLLNSKNRTYGTSSDFTVSLGRFLDKYRFRAFRIMRVLIKANIYNVNETNNVFYFSQEDNTDPLNPVIDDFIIQIPFGNYDLDTLVSVLQNLMRTETGHGQYFVTANEQSGKITFALTLANFDFQISGGAGFPNNINEVIGFRNVTYNYVDEITGDYACDFTYCNEIHIRSNLSTSTVYSDYDDAFTDICEIIFNTDSGFELINHEPLRPIACDCSNVGSVNFRVTDEDNNTLNLNGKDWSILIELISPEK